MPLTDDQQNQANALGIDWKSLLVQFGQVLGPIVLQTLIAFLSSLKLKAQGVPNQKCVPGCHAACVDAALTDATRTVAHLVHLRSCCEE